MKLTLTSIERGQLVRKEVALAEDTLDLEIELENGTTFQISPYSSGVEVRLLSIGRLTLRPGADRTISLEG